VARTRRRWAPPDFYTGGGQSISKIVVATCNESSLQKWNAPPNILQGHPPQ
jgi:hypothetical protein